MYRRFPLAVLSLTLAMVVSAPGHVRAGSTTLEFSVLGLNDYDPIPDGFGSNAANTPNILVSYRTFLVSTGSTLQSNLLYWGAGYGDLPAVAFAASDGYGAEIKLTPTAGASVTIDSFDLSAWFQTNRTIGTLRILDGNGSVLLDYGTTTILGAGPTHSSFTPNLTSSSGIVIQWGSDWNVGIDNVTFSEVSVVPEPASWLLIGGAIPAIVLAIRRRNS